MIEHYEQNIYRKYKWYTYINQQKAEFKMVKRFKAKMGGPTESVLLIGDYDQKGCYMKGLPPTKGISIRRTLRKSGYKVYLVNEYNTSCKLYKTGEDLVEFRGKRTPLALKAYNEEGLIPKNKNTALKYFSDKLIRTLSQKELLKLSKIAIIEPDEPALAAIQQAMHVEHSIAEIKDSNFFGMQHLFVMCIQSF